MSYAKYFLLIFLISCIQNNNQTTLDKIQSLELNSIQKPVTAYYTDGSKHNAAELIKLLTGAQKYFSDTFRLSETFSIAVLDSQSWKRITQIPYGLPFVSGPPNVVCFPSTTNNELGKLIRKSINGYNLQDKFSLTNDELTNTFISMIGFHELGHIYAREYGINFPNIWTFEFAATYFAYSYLVENHIDKAEIWNEIGEILLNEIEPTYTSLNDFENLYFRVGTANYSWYQIVLLQRVKEVFELQGVQFIKELVETKLTSGNKYFSVDKFEKIEPGFEEWANKYNLL
ncbi:MAG: hypothetical protein K9J16_02925 [Melioribacteraceae bacterium]|nr:hypothetical protein [Melioribacteraceae bacterium]MCF8352962.1 hypothetical protein [Melioribacteraceae bacterium]MCF8395831.1 hypothetical protein [Melioribacteraceae bacterium]MCF8417479.1 hypothetical protein [Melioribacteraceae bacterium]